MASACLALLRSVGIGVLVVDLSGDHTRAVDVVESIVKHVKVHAVLVGGLLKLNLNLLVGALVLLHERVHGLQQGYLVVQRAGSHDLRLRRVLSALGGCVRSGLVAVVTLETEFLDNLTAGVVENDELVADNSFDDLLLLVGVD